MSGISFEDSFGGGPHRIKRTGGGHGGSYSGGSYKLRAAKGHPEAVLKVMKKYPRSSSGVRNLVDYISRDGALELLDEQGLFVQSEQERADLVDQWSGSFSKRTNGRCAMHLIISTPEGTKKEDVEEASEEWGRENLSDYSYAFVTHEEGDKEEPHPHAHFVVARKAGGPPLNPRKADLRTWRESWADIGSAHGIPMTATRRHERGVIMKAAKSQDIHIRKRDGYTQQDLSAAQEAIDEARERLIGQGTNTKKDEPWKSVIKDTHQAQRDKMEEISKKMAEKLQLAQKNKIDLVVIEKMKKHKALVGKQAFALRKAITRNDALQIALMEKNLDTLPTAEELAKLYVKVEPEVKLTYFANDTAIKKSIDGFTKLANNAMPAKNTGRELKKGRERDRGRDRDLDFER